jgi:steroid 5-alpha reductase family enzyme
MFDLTLWLTALGALCAVATGGWLLSLPLRNVSLVDSLWSLKFLLCGLLYAGLSGASGPRSTVLLVLLALWALRLAAHITWRNRGHGEDRRYQAIRRNNEPGFAWKSLYIVFGLQAVLAWIISLPLLAAVTATRPLGLLDAFGAGLWLLGFVFEAGGDLQLARFKANPANVGRVMDRGFWRYTRHPNYFGDFCVWWGFYALALSGGGWWSIPGPLLMSALLMKVSGVTLLEKDIGERRPDYADYIRRTPAFFPGRPHSGHSDAAAR